MRGVLACALILAMTGTACAVSTQDHAGVASEDAVPFALLDGDAPSLVPTTVAGPVAEEVQLWFVRDGRLVLVVRPLDAPVDPEDAVAALASPPTDAPETLRTAVPDPQVIRDITVAAGVARVDLAASIAELGGDDQLLAVAQIVCTLTALPGVGQVAFALEGLPTEVPRGDGSVVSQPVSRDDYAPLLA
jgi:spore germination protein GerM